MPVRLPIVPVPLAADPTGLRRFRLPDTGFNRSAQMPGQEDLVVRPLFARPFG